MIELACANCGKLLRIPMEYRGQTGKCNGCGGPVHVPANALTQAQKALLKTVTQTAVAVVEEDQEDWRDEPASKKQLSYLADLGATPSQMRGLTKGQASELIERLQDEPPASRPAQPGPDYHRELLKAQKDTARAVRKASRSNSDCLTCLIIILLLLFTPVWLPIVLAALAVIGLAG